jgi:large subunit ribosomal protein L20
MPRVKRGIIAHKRRKNVLEDAKGFRWGRHSKFKLAKQALMKAWSYAYRDRKTKKREMRKIWNVAINIGCRKNGTTYREFINLLKTKNVELNRKVLSDLAKERPETFAKVVEEVKK